MAPARRGARPRGREPATPPAARPVAREAKARWPTSAASRAPRHAARPRGRAGANDDPRRARRNACRSAWRVLARWPPLPERELERDRALLERALQPVDAEVEPVPRGQGANAGQHGVSALEQLPLHGADPIAALAIGEGGEEGREPGILLLE